MKAGKQKFMEITSHIKKKKKKKKKKYKIKKIYKYIGEITPELSSNVAPAKERGWHKFTNLVNLEI